MFLAKSGRPGSGRYWAVGVEKLIWQLQRSVQHLHSVNHALRQRVVDAERDKARLESVLDAAPIGYCLLDRTGTILELNAEAAKKLSRDGTPCAGTLLADAFMQADRDAFNQCLHDVTLAEPKGAATVQVKASGGAVVLRVRLSPLRASDDGHKPRWIATLEDVTEQCAMREREARFWQIAAFVQDVYYETDAAGKVLCLSSGYDLVWHRSGSDASHGDWFHALHPDDLAHVTDARRLLLKGDPFDEQYRIVRPDGEIRWVHDRAFLIEGPEAHVVGVARDITDDRELEEELRQAQKLEAIGTLASSVAHDFGNLLQGVMGCLNIALGETTTPDRSRDYTRQALVAVRGGATLVGQLMRFGRKEHVRQRPIGIDSAITSCSKLLQRLLGDHIQLCIEPGAPRCTMLADPVQIEQILMNLAANARDAMPGGGRLVIRTEEVTSPASSACNPLSTVRLEVRDIGCGMDPETRARVFEPFFTTKEPGKGTGLGLAAVRAVTRALGGHVSVETEVGLGTAFIFDFPSVVATPPAPRRALPNMRFVGRALLVEDDWRVRIGVRRYLEELGFDVVEAGDAVEAMERADGCSLLVTDVVLPEVSGPKIRTMLQGRYPDMKAVFISAHPAPYLTEHGLLEQDAIVLQKPFEVQDLAYRLGELYPAPHAGQRRSVAESRGHAVAS
jgi:two-component system, cell cycle sensor histidine kinase and response regulator CckA